MADKTEIQEEQEIQEPEAQVSEPEESSKAQPEAIEGEAEESAVDADETDVETPETESSDKDETTPEETESVEAAETSEEPEGEAKQEESTDEAKEEKSDSKKKGKRKKKPSAPVDDVVGEESDLPKVESATEAKAIIEAILFSTNHSMSPRRLTGMLPGWTESQVLDLLTELRDEFDEAGRGLMIHEVAGGWTMATRPRWADYVYALHKAKKRNPLTPQALETLAIVAYKQPITRADIEVIRGVDAGGMLRNLIDLNLVEIVGHRETLGRPPLYGTTNLFLRTFGLKTLGDLPSVDELASLLPDENEQPELPLTDEVKAEAAAEENAEGEQTAEVKTEANAKETTEPETAESEESEAPESSDAEATEETDEDTAPVDSDEESEEIEGSDDDAEESDEEELIDEEPEDVDDLDEENKDDLDEDSEEDEFGDDEEDEEKFEDDEDDDDDEEDEED